MFEVADPNFWLPRFIREVRRGDGEPYPPKTIHQLLAGMQRHMLQSNCCLPKFLDWSNPLFRPIHGACDFIFHELHSKGVGVYVRHTPIISNEEEQKLWELGILGVDSSKSLEQTVFYYIGKRYCIRGGEERQLGPSNFVRSYHRDCFTYIEHGSKNYSGRTKDFRYENKKVPCPALFEERPSCLVYLLDLYLTKLPPYAFDKDVLYLRPK